MFRKVLVVNRGEIAVRLIRCLREMGLASVALFSDPDRHAPHVRMADQAVHLPGSTSAETYMNVPALLEAARQVGADAVHPGYGFLSEQAHFARTCAEQGLVFIGPKPAAIESMGDKTAARHIMQQAGVPIVPGFQQEGASYADVAQAASAMGFPVMLKAAAGGGGKGMRLVHHLAQLASAYDQARSEALGAFADDRVYLEKFIQSPRHIEVQVVCDQFGNGVHFGERECTIQRRHQKVLEEAPSPAVDADLRASLGEIGLRAARAASYDSIGTVEFLMDVQRKVYFLEMNTRLQVEHPVTEWITGRDLVRLQIEIAQGQPLPFRQEDVRFSGHSLECRIYAEEPEKGFRPSPGRITQMLAPGGPGVRNDAGVQPGFEVPLFYDPLISKISTWAPSREEAIARMQRALAETKIGGIKTNLSFQRRLLRHPLFQSAEFDTGFIERHPELLQSSPSDERSRIAVMAAAIKYYRTHQVRRLNQSAARGGDAWQAQGRRELMRGGKA